MTIPVVTENGNQTREVLTKDAFAELVKNQWKIDLPAKWASYRKQLEKQSEAVLAMDELTLFKRGLMHALLDDEHCLQKLSNIATKLSLKAFEHEEIAKRRREEQNEVEELILFLQRNEK